MPKNPFFHCFTNLSLQKLNKSLLRRYCHWIHGKMHHRVTRVKCLGKYKFQSGNPHFVQRHRMWTINLTRRPIIGRHLNMVAAVFFLVNQQLRRNCSSTRLFGPGTPLSNKHIFISTITDMNIHTRTDGQTDRPARLYARISMNIWSGRETIRRQKLGATVSNYANTGILFYFDAWLNEYVSTKYIYLVVRVRTLQQLDWISHNI